VCQPKIAINCFPVAPFSAAMHAPTLRSPCAVQCGSSRLIASISKFIPEAVRRKWPTEFDNQQVRSPPVERPSIASKWQMAPSELSFANGPPVARMAFKFRHKWTITGFDFSDSAVQPIPTSDWFC